MRLTFAAACFWVVIVAGAATSEGVRLLTANRRPDPASATGVPPAELAKAGYYAVPRQEGEAGGPENLISFAQGILSDGSVSGNWRVQPPTYAYWTGTPRGELVFELGVPCLISAVRVHVFATKSSGVRRIRLFDREDVVELPDGVLLGSLEPPVPGWNAFENVGTFTDGLRLVFDRAPGKD